MRKLRMMLYAIAGLLATTAPAFAQAADNESTVASSRVIATVFGFALAAGLGAIGQSRIASAAVEGAARNPGAAGRLQIMMIIGLALIESLVIFALVVVFTR